MVFLSLLMERRVKTKEDMRKEEMVVILSFSHGEVMMMDS
jgi:hypothetical protein